MDPAPPPPSPAPADLPNPFVNPYRWDAYSIFKAAVCFVFLVPFRALLFVLSGITIVTFGYLAAVLYRPKEDAPVHIPHAFDRLLCLCIRGILLSFGFWWVTITDERRDRRAAPLPSVIVANHTSLMDCLALGWCFGPSFVAKRGVDKLPIIGTLARLAQCIYVQRDDPDSRAKAKAAIQMRAATPGFRPLVLFPEGMCTNGKCLITFRLGAFYPGVPILPVMIRYPHRFLNPSDREAGGNPFLLALQFANHLEILICEPYTPTEAERACPELFATNVRDLFLGKLGIPGTRTLEDDVALRAAAGAVDPGHSPRADPPAAACASPPNP